MKKDYGDENTQIPVIQNVRTTQSLRDTLTLMKSSKIFLKLVETPNGDVFRKGNKVKPLGKINFEMKIEKHDITPEFEILFIITGATAKPLNFDDKITVI